MVPGLFPKFGIRRDTETELVTTLGGGRYGTSVGGTMTGRGFDVIIMDDPLNAEKGHSDTAWTRVNDYFRNMFISRLDDQNIRPATRRLTGKDKYRWR